MASSDPHQGGDLSDMAATGTKMPNDAGEHNLIPSVPRPDQKAEDPRFHQQFINAADSQGAVDNASDVPRQFADSGATGEVITGIGDQLPAEVESKNLHYEPNNPLAKGHDRYDKHTKQKDNAFETMQGADGTADPAPGEEEDTQDQIRDRKGL